MDDIAFTSRNTETFLSVQTVDVSAFDQPIGANRFVLHLRRNAADPGLPAVAFDTLDDTLEVVSEDTEEATLTLKFCQLDTSATCRLTGNFVGDLVVVIEDRLHVVATATATFTTGVTRVAL